MALETKLTQPVTEQQSPRNLHNTSHLFTTSGKEEPQSPEDYEMDEEVEKELEGDGSVWVDGAKAIGQLNQLGFGWGLITKQWDQQTSGLGDLDEFGEDGGLRYEEDDLLGTEEYDEWGSMDSSEMKEEDEPHEFSGERLGLGLLRKEVESLTVALRETPASGEKGATPWTDDDEEEEEGEGTRDRHGRSREEVEGSGSGAEQGNYEAAQGDGVVDVGGDKEITWYFTWK